MKEKVIFVSLNQYREYSGYIFNNIVNTHDASIVYLNNEIEYLKQITKYSKKVIDGKITKLIGIDNLGAMGFVVSSKTSGMIVAQINDEHSSLMTRDHNGANALMIGALISSKEVGLRIVNIFLESNFSAGRHMVRVDMLNKMAK